MHADLLSFSAVADPASNLNSAEFFRFYGFDYTPCIPSGSQFFQEVEIDFENVCRLHPRVLRIASQAAARKFHLNTEVLCMPKETPDPAQVLQ